MLFSRGSSPPRNQTWVSRTAGTSANFRPDEESSFVSLYKLSAQSSSVTILQDSPYTTMSQFAIIYSFWGGTHRKLYKGREGLFQLATISLVLRIVYGVQ